MPAIQPARLHQQVAQLAERQADPPAFVRGLHVLLEFYADRTRRPGQSGYSSPLLTSYRVQPAVLREVAQSLAPVFEKDQAAGLALVDGLYAEPVLEFRLLAARLLGQLSLEFSREVFNRLDQWIAQPAPAKARLSPSDIKVILDYATATLRRQAPLEVVQQAQAWLDSNRLVARQAGLLTLILLARETDFDNLPLIFRLAQPFLTRIPSSLRPDVSELIRLLARRSPQETAYALRQALSMPEHPDTPWLIRQVLDEFPPEQQAGLRQQSQPGQ